MTADDRCPFEREIEVAVAAAPPGRVRLELAHRDGNANRNGTLHGGVIASLVAIAGARAACGPGAGVGSGGAPLDLSVQFVSAASRSDVVVTAGLLRRGREVGFAEVAVDTAAGEPVARGMLAARTAGLDPPSGEAAVGVERMDEALGRLDRARFSGSAFSARLRISSASLSSGGVVAVLPWQELLADGSGAVHPGAIATLVDAAGGAAAWTRGGFDSRGRAATIAMHLAIGAASRGEDLVAIARAPWPVDRFSSIVVDVVRRADAAPVATGAVVYRVDRPTT